MHCLPGTQSQVEANAKSEKRGQEEAKEKEKKNLPLRTSLHTKIPKPAGVPCRAPNPQNQTGSLNVFKQNNQGIMKQGL